MKIVQVSSRAIRIESQGGSIVLPYRLYWNGHDRLPESIVLEDTRVQAFFLFATVKDEISEDEHGLRIDRSWSVMTPGTIRLTIDADFVSDDVSFLFPGVAAGRAGDPVSFLGERTSLPSAVFVFGGRAGSAASAGAARSGPAADGFLLFTGFPKADEEASSIGVRRVHGDDGASLSVEVRVPAVEEPRAVTGPRPGNTAEPDIRDIESTGSLSRRMTLYAVFAPRKEIVAAGMSAAAARLPRTAPPRLPGPDAYRAALGACLETHLLEAGGVMGLREVPGGDLISASAGMEAALDLLSGASGDPTRVETAMRLADFCLKGQHPSGLFYESYSLSKKTWVGAAGTTKGKGAGAEGPLVPFAESARIADCMLRFSESLRGMGLPFEKYFLAGTRFADGLCDEKGRLWMPGALHLPGDREPAEKGLSALEAFFPLSRMFALTKKDKYRKACAALASDFLSKCWDPAGPPSWREGRDPDCRAALLAGRIAMEITRAGMGEPDPDVFISLLAPWVHLNRPAREQAADPVGGITDSFDRHRLLFSGAETAYVLLCLGSLSRSRPAADLASELSRAVLDFSLHAPLGTAYFQHTRWDAEGKDAAQTRGRLGPVDSRRLAREAYFAALLYGEFGAWMRGGVLTRAAQKKKPASARRPAAGARKTTGARPAAAARKPAASRKGK